MLARILGFVFSPLGKATGAALAAAALLLGVRKSGRDAERNRNLKRQLKASEAAHETKDRQLDAAARRPRTRNDLADRLRDGRF